MLRRSLHRLSTGTTLVEAIKGFEHVWNIKFDGKPITNKMDFHNSEEYKYASPMFSVMDLQGKVEHTENDPNLSQEMCDRIMTTMVTQNTMDNIMLEAQRQGRISFYMTCFGEEAQSTASTAAVKDNDEIFLQYREAPALMYRGYGVKEMISQCMGNKEDVLKGRQMPIHYGSKKLNIQMVSSPLGTQIPQAAGAGYAFKLEADDRIAMCFFGEGAASEGDFHAGLNFASIVGSHTLFFCRNNGFAISTSSLDQYHGSGILPRGISYGIPSIRVDGNDVLAVYAAVKRAREIIKNDNTPVLIEAMSYRVSHHSTSDDSTLYRPKEEVLGFDILSPIRRFGMYMESKGWWSEERTKSLQKDTLKLLQSELKRQEAVDLWPVSALFEDTYKEMTPTLRAQRDETVAHYERNKDLYTQAKH